MFPRIPGMRPKLSPTLCFLLKAWQGVLVEIWSWMPNFCGHWGWCAFASPAEHSCGLSEEIYFGCSTWQLNEVKRMRETRRYVLPSRGSLCLLLTVKYCMRSIDLNFEWAFDLRWRCCKEMHYKVQVMHSAVLYSTVCNSDLQVSISCQMEEPALLVDRPYQMAPYRGSPTAQANCLTSPTTLALRCLFAGIKRQLGCTQI